MDWKKEEEEKPEFGVEVLAWHTCEACRDKKEHAHQLVARGYPIHGPFIATYHQADMALVNHYRKKGDHSWDWAAIPYWSPIRPSHWANIVDPYKT